MLSVTNERDCRASPDEGNTSRHDKHFWHVGVTTANTGTLVTLVTTVSTKAVVTKLVINANTLEVFMWSVRQSRTNLTDSLHEDLRGDARTDMAKLVVATSSRNAPENEYIIHVLIYLIKTIFIVIAMITPNITNIRSVNLIITNESVSTASSRNVVCIAFDNRQFTLQRSCNLPLCYVTFSWLK